MSATLENPTQVLELELDHVVPSPLNPRTKFDQAELKKLATSLKAHGQLQEIVVFNSSREDEPGYEIIAGERRWRAAKIAKLKTVRCRVIDVTEEEAIEIRGIENFQRENFNAIEEAKWFKQMVDQCNYTQSTLAKKLGVTQSHISNRIRLLSLPEFFQDKIISREIMSTQARQLVPLMKHEKICKELEKNFSTDVCKDPNQFDHYVVSAIAAVANRMEPYQIEFKRTTKIDKELQLLMYTDSDGNAYEFALNVDLWKELQKEARKKNGSETSKTSRLEPNKLKKRTATCMVYLRKIEDYKEEWLAGKFRDLKTIPHNLLFPLLLIEGQTTKTYQQIFSFTSEELVNEVINTIKEGLAESWNYNCMEECARQLGIDMFDKWKFDRMILEHLDSVELEFIAKDWKLLSKKADKEQFAKLEKAETRRLWIEERGKGLTAPKCLLKKVKS